MKDIWEDPTLLFAGVVCGKAEEAIEYYSEVFSNSSKGHINRYKDGEARDSRTKINYGELNIGEMQFVMMDHRYGSTEEFNEVFSFIIKCENQEELDYYWSRLSHKPEDEQCGWVKDKFGVSWQIVPKMINDTFKNIIYVV